MESLPDAGAATRRPRSGAATAEGANMGTNASERGVLIGCLLVSWALGALALALFCGVFVAG